MNATTPHLACELADAEAERCGWEPDEISQRKGPETAENRRSGAEFGFSSFFERRAWNLELSLWFL